MSALGQEGERVDGVALERQRTLWTFVGGAVLVIAGLVILGNVVIATAVSVLFLGWTSLIAGIALFIVALTRIKAGGFWSAALGGAVLAVLGLFILRNPEISALTVTILAGALFFTSGLTRIIVGFQVPEARWVLVLSGAISLVLGLIVLFNLAEATFTLLGILLGIQALLEGITLAAFGRLRVTTDVA